MQSLLNMSAHIDGQRGRYWKASSFQLWYVFPSLLALTVIWLARNQSLQNGLKSPWVNFPSACFYLSHFPFVKALIPCWALNCKSDSFKLDHSFIDTIWSQWQHSVISEKIGTDLTHGLAFVQNMVLSANAQKPTIQILFFHEKRKERSKEILIMKDYFKETNGERPDDC